MKPGATPGPLDNLVVLAGGADGSGNARDGVETYNYQTQQFSFLANMVVHRYGQVAYQTPQGNLVIAGGCLNNTYDATGLAETYNPSTNSFSQLSNAMTTTRCFPTGTELADGSFLITGGTAGAHADTVNTSAEVFSPGAYTFTAVGSMSTPAAAASAVAFPFNPNGTTAAVLVSGGVTSDTDQNIPGGTPTTSAEIYTYTPNISVLLPKYQVTSIIYSPPGNQSSSGFTKSTINGTTTTLGNSFGNAQSISFTEGFKPYGTGPSVTESFGLSFTSTNTSAFTETYTDATGVSNQTFGGNGDAINHNMDLFLIWLNPQVEVALSGSTPVSYTVSNQGLADVAPDILKISAITMMPNGLGNTTVYPGYLWEQTDPSTQAPTPGLASICAHVIVSEYTSKTCTLADQCGCRPSDFAPILALDKLLNQPGTSDPTSVDGSGSSACSNPTPSLDCRYVPVPLAPGQSPIQLSGPQSSGGNSNPNTFTQTDSTTKTQTYKGTTVESVGVSFKAGSPVFSLSIGDTLMWSQTQSTGTTNGSSNAEMVSLNSNTLGCIEDIDIYEDTSYHTFAFAQPTNNSTCGQTDATNTSLFISPQTIIEGGTVTLTATVTPSAGGTPNGSVQFMVGANVVATTTLNSSGVATLSASTSGVAPGVYSATAEYLGNSTFSHSTSTGATLTILPASRRRLRWQPLSL